MCYHVYGYETAHPVIKIWLVQFGWSSLVRVWLVLVRKFWFAFGPVWSSSGFGWLVWLVRVGPNPDRFQIWTNRTKRTKPKLDQLVQTQTGSKFGPIEPIGSNPNWTNWSKPRPVPNLDQSNQTDQTQTGSKTPTRLLPGIFAGHVGMLSAH